MGDVEYEKKIDAENERQMMEAVPWTKHQSRILPLKRIIMKGRSVVPDIFCVIIESVLYLLFILFVLGLIAGYFFLTTHLIRATIDLFFDLIFKI